MNNLHDRDILFLFYWAQKLDLVQFCRSKKIAVSPRARRNYPVRWGMATIREHRPSLLTDQEAVTPGTEDAPKSI